MKLETSLMPRRPKPWTTTAPNTKTGNADSINDFANHPGSTQINAGVQSKHFSGLSLQDFVPSGCLFGGSESKHVDDTKSTDSACAELHGSTGMSCGSHPQTR
jgi:hypothetical protein